MSSAHLFENRPDEPLQTQPEATEEVAAEPIAENTMGDAIDESWFASCSMDAWEWVQRNFLKTWFVSFLIHVGLLVLLGLITLTSLPENTISLLMDSDENSLEEVATFTEIEIAVEQPELDTQLLSSLDNSVSQLESEVPFQAEEFADFGDFSFSELEAFSELPEMELMRNDGPNFFAAPSQANKIVFVVDNSNSMSRGRLETAMYEMEKTIALMDKSQEFYIVFYSDTAYRMFHPKAERKMIPATQANKVKVSKWLKSIEMCLQTKGYEALEIAAKLKPDVIYLLGDGAFTDDTARRIVTDPFKRVVIHTLGMEVSERNAVQFKKIADLHKGTYKDVGVTAEGLRILKQAGSRPRNRIRGKVWGVELRPN